MDIQRFDIEGLLLIKPKIHGDYRGYFFESFNKSKFEQELGYEVNFIQDNESKSRKGVLRGLHFQRPPFTQAKLVRVIEGKVLDVAVDLRIKSRTFGQSQTVVLSGENKHQFFVPRGFAHGFVVLSESATFSYKVDNEYAPSYDGGIIYSDNQLDIDWKLESESVILSKKDLHLPSFENYKRQPIF